METIDAVCQRLLNRFPGAEVSLAPNGAPGGVPSIRIGAERAREMAEFLRDAPGLRMDFCSNVTGVDRPDHIEVVYHLYSVEMGHGPVVVRMRTANRTDQVGLPSLTPVWRSAELQEREVFDLFGVVFAGHPDLRRLLMWEEFAGHPMRRDFQDAGAPAEGGPR
jgi:NADH-quinone oxidoreductase subunit C